MKNKSMTTVLSVIILGVALIVGVALLTESKRALNKVSTHEALYQSFYGSDATAKLVDGGGKITFLDFLMGSEEESLVDTVLEVTVSQNIVGYIYLIEKDNAYGNIRLALGISNNVIEHVSLIRFSQSVPSQTASDAVKLEFENLKGVSVADALSSLDHVTGATTSYRTILDLVEDIIKSYQKAGEAA